MEQETISDQLSPPPKIQAVVPVAQGRWLDPMGNVSPRPVVGAVSPRRE